jgi:molybdopterin converting factor small subunit
MRVDGSLRVRVRLHGHLHTYVESKQTEFELELRNETTVDGLIRTLSIPDPEVWVISVNGEKASMSTNLADGDLVSIFPPVEGGSSRIDS